MKFIDKKYFILIAFTTLLNIVSTQRKTKCGSIDKFQCDNGECIDSTLLCDGTGDCQDKSDETILKCNNSGIVCSPFAFKCKYGACIDGDLKCNGVPDCIDNSDEEPSECPDGIQNTNTENCSSKQFRCNNGQCIQIEGVCDGITDCRDKSDETNSICGNNKCDPYLFRCKYGACVDGDSICNNVRNCADGSDESPELCDNIKKTTTTSTTYRPFIIPSSSTTTSTPLISKQILCSVPSQPPNGYRKLNKGQCGQQHHCDVREGLKLPSGSVLIYTCNPGYQISSFGDVVCGIEGQWLNIPNCTKINCKPLGSVSTRAECYFNGQWTSCENSVIPGTTANLSCRNSYREDTTYLSLQRNVVRCNENGQWEPEPLECVPVCGVVSLKGKPLIVHGDIPNTSMIPWHATLYNQETPNGPKDFICGATIIKEKFLLTAAHCVYDETNKKIHDSKRYYVATGNIFRDYDSGLHDKQYVKKAKVKNIYVNCRYLGFEGNYAWDIAILEIEKPFVFSASLLPACLDNTYIDYGLGIVAGFGRTDSGPSSSLLQYVKLPYVPLNQCKSTENALQSEKFITMDKFCAGYTNGTAVCDGDSGGGLVFRTGDLWYLRGIVSIGLGEKLVGGTRTCDSFSYSLYTRVSSHLSWIQDVTFRVETSKPPLLC